MYFLAAFHSEPDSLYRGEVRERIAVEDEEVGGRAFDEAERRAFREDGRGGIDRQRTQEDGGPLYMPR